MHVACLQHHSSKSMPACSITAACACEVSRHTNRQVYTDSTSCYCQCCVSNCTGRSDAVTMLCVNDQEHGSSHADLLGYAHHGVPVTPCHSYLTEVQASYGADSKLLYCTQLHHWLRGKCQLQCHGLFFAVKEASERRRQTGAASNAVSDFIGASCTCMHMLNVTGCRPAALPLQEALDSSRQERESSDAEWDARHQEAVDSAEQWKAFADKLTKEKEEQQQQLASASSELQVELMRLLHVECLGHLICHLAASRHAQAFFEQRHTKCRAT